MKKFIKDVKENAKTLRRLFDETDFYQDQLLSEKYKANIFLKREDQTPVRSYKIRGAYCFINKYKKQNENNKNMYFICASAGNHAQGFAYACRELKQKGKVYMPVTTPKQKIDMTKYWGQNFVEVVLVGDTFDDASAAAQEEYKKNKNSFFVPPFDHKDIVAGQATVADEVFNQSRQNIDYLVVPVGGGGVSAGIAKYFEIVSPKTKIIIVEPENADSFATSVRNKKNTKLEKISTFVDGAAVKKIGNYNFRVLKKLIKEKTIISPEGRLSKTILEFLTHNGIILEPAGALSVDALNDEKLLKKIKGKNVVCVVTGGNFDFTRLPEIQEKALKYSNLKKYIVLRLPQRPGTLKGFLGSFEDGVDITRFEYLKKSSKNFGSVLIGLESQKKEALKQSFDRFTRSGYDFQDITDEQMFFDLLI